MTVRKYTSRSQQTTLTSAITSGATSMTVASAANLRGTIAEADITGGATFTVVIDPDTALEEIVDITSASSNTFTITRSVDATSTATDHSAGAVVRHMIIGRDLREPNTHSEASSSVHGLTSTSGVVVGTAATQTLTNKTLTSPTINGATLSGTITNTGTVTGGTITGSVVTGLSAPSNGSDATTKTYVDSILGSATAAATSAASAAASATAAATSATSAAASATAAATSASSALTSQTAAATSATSAGTSATAAATSATSAAASASAAATSATSAAASASAASTSATSAAASATTAAASVATIATYASNALASSSAAATSATSAAASATAAASSAGLASTYSLNASNSALASATSAASASVSATSSAASATAAAISASSASLSASSASSSASAAAASESSAAYSASSATASSVAAATSAASAAASATTAAGYVPSLTGNNGKYLTTDGITTSWGTVQALPTQTGNNGKYLKTDGSTASWATVSGALAQPTEPASPTDGQVWVNTSTSAVAAIASVTRWSVTPAAGTTSLSGVDNYSFPLQYKVGYEMVHLNGALLSRGNDYTATSGTSITLTNPTAAGDIVEVICPNELAYADTYSQTVADSVFMKNTNAFVAGKNKIINGDFNIWQRGTSFSNNSTGDVYTADRWVSQVNGTGTRTITRNAFTPGTSPVAGYEGAYYLSLGCSSSGTATYFNIKQRIEDVRSFAGQTVTVSFWAKASASLTTGFFGFTQVFGTGGSGNIDTAGTNLTFTTSWTRYTQTFSIPSVAGKTIGANSMLEMAISFNNSTFTSFDIWGVQVESGSVATAFQTATGTQQGELAACQRYYVRFGADTNFNSLPGAGIAYATNGFSFNTVLPVTMRAVPSAIEYSTLKATDGVSDFALSSVTLSTTGSSKNVGAWYCSATGLTQYRYYGAAINSSASGYLAFTAEL